MKPLDLLTLARERIAKPEDWHPCYCLGIHRWTHVDAESHLWGHYGYERALVPHAYSLIGALTYPAGYPNEAQPKNWYEDHRIREAAFNDTIRKLAAEIWVRLGVRFWC